MESDGPAPAQPGRPLRVLVVFERLRTGSFEDHLKWILPNSSRQDPELFTVSGEQPPATAGPGAPRRHLNADFQTFTGNSVAQAAQAIADLISREAIGVVHVYPSLSILPAALGASLAGVPYVVTFREAPDLPEWAAEWGAFFLLSLARYVLPGASAVRSATEEAQAGAAAAFGPLTGEPPEHAAEAVLEWLLQMGDESLGNGAPARWDVPLPSALFGSAAEQELFRLAARGAGRQGGSDFDASAARLAATETALLRAEHVRQMTLLRCRQFRAAFEEQLSVYRSQRAWKVMLWCRKAYALLRRSGLAGKTKLAWFAFSTLWKGAEGLGEHDIKLPALEPYLPWQVREPFAARIPGENPGPGEEEPAAAKEDECMLFPGARKYDIVILPAIDFDFRFQRPQQIASHFAEDGHRVFWVSPTRFLPLASRRPFEVMDLGENLWEVRLRARQMDIYQDALSDEAAREFLDSLDALYGECSLAASCVIVELAFWRRLGLGLRERFGSVLVYDCMDDWDGFARIGRFSRAEERLLAAECDVLTVTARNLAEKFERHGRTPLLVRNAADFEFFANAGDPRNPLASIPGPIIGYFGAIAEWLDLDLVAEVARKRPHYSFVFLGEVFDQDLTPLASLANVHLLGHQPYEEMPRYLRHFDVCMIPFVINRLTNATDPVKLYEYLSQGKAVVATPMAELPDREGLVFLARDAGEFAAKLDQALAESDAAVALRRCDFARRNTWQDRIQTIDGAVREAFPLVSILVLTHNSEGVIEPCLDSILRNTTYPAYEVVAADNCSTDGTRSMLRAYAAAHPCVGVTEIAKNLGFAAGNNVAARQARGRYLVFLNADTIVTPRWLELLLRHFQHDPSLGLLAPVTNFAGNELKIDVGYGTLAEMEEFSRRLAYRHAGESFDIEMAPLFCAMMPAEVWQRTGELDESFGLGMFEDDDLSYRVRKAGLRVAGAADCFIHHFGGSAFSKLDPRTYQELFERNRARFEAKWNVSWQPHRTRPGVTPATDEIRFNPRDFRGGSGARRQPALRPAPLSPSRSTAEAAPGEASSRLPRPHSSPA